MGYVVPTGCLLCGCEGSPGPPDSLWHRVWECAAVEYLRTRALGCAEALQAMRAHLTNVDPTAPPHGDDPDFPIWVAATRAMVQDPAFQMQLGGVTTNSSV